MALTKCKLGELIEKLDNKNDDLKYGVEYALGVSNNKELMPTKADLYGRDLAKFSVIHPGDFVYNHRTSRHGDKFCIAYNTTEDDVICTEDYTVFRIKDECKSQLLNEWLYMYFHRSEMDRFVMFSSWGSSTEFFNWEDMCDIDIELPDLPTQQKYVDIYNAMIANQQSYECGLEDLKLICDGYIEDLRRKIPCKKIDSYIEEVSVKNEENIHDANSIRGICINKEFIPTKADTNGISLDNYKIVTTNQFAFNPNTARMGDKICVALNKSSTPYLVSSIYPVFKIIDHDILLPEYLMMWIKRKEFDRYARFNSWGSARETFNFCDMLEVEIPIPEIKIQKAIVDIYDTYIKRKEINEQLKFQIKNICPIFIQGSLEEGKAK